MLTEQLTKHAVSRTSLESLRLVMFFETFLINLAKICVSRLAVAPHGGPWGGKPEGFVYFFENSYAHRASKASALRRPQLEPRSALWIVRYSPVVI